MRLQHELIRGDAEADGERFGARQQLARRRRRFLGTSLVVLLGLLVLSFVAKPDVFALRDRDVGDGAFEAGLSTAPSLQVPFDALRSGRSHADTERTEALRSLLPQYPDIAEVLAQPQLYSQELMALLLRNPETLDFVLAYPQRHLQTEAPLLKPEEIAQTEVPLLMQWDQRWGYLLCGDGMLALTGCAPTCLAMVAAKLIGDSTLTPARMAKTLVREGYYVDGVGMSWDAMWRGARLFGLRGEEIALSYGEIVDALEAGQPIVCCMRPGDFTSTGHFIVLSGIDANGDLIVRDPNSIERSERSWSYEQLQAQISALWAFAKA